MHFTSVFMVIAMINSAMRLDHTIIEAVDPDRERIRNVLEQNKSKIQRNRSRIGVRLVLQKLFPEADWELFGEASGGGMANWDPRTQRVTMGGVGGLISAKKARKDWTGFVDDITRLLTHELIHKEQSARRDHWWEEIKKKDVPEDVQEKLKQKYQDLADTYYTFNRPEDLEALDKFALKANKMGMRFPLGRKHYLANKDEVMSHAEGIAADTITLFKRQGMEHEEAKRAALKALQSNPNKVIGMGFNDYRKYFKSGDKTFRRLYKQIAHYIQRS
jgi:hypothetical protein